MPRTPSRQQNGQLGPVNPAGSARAVPPALIRQQGPAQALEHFNGLDLPPNVARAMNAIQENVRQAVAQTKGNPFANGNLLENVTLVASTPKVLNHGLGAPWRGYFIGKMSSPTVVGFVPNVPASLDASQFQLEAANDCIVDVWVYA